MLQLSVGDVVKLHTPENARLHNTDATIHTLTEYGAIVHAPAAATKQFRAHFSEMVSPRLCKKIGAAVEQGYSGDVCLACGGCRMRRTGVCMTCDDCGNADGCG